MANRQGGYGLTAELKNKQDAKYNVEIEQEVRLWMEKVLGEKLDPSSDSSKPLGSQRFHEVLKDGVFLCKLSDKVVGGVKHSPSKMAFKQMENVNAFLQSCSKLGLPASDTFQTVDLYENQNMWQVVICLSSYKRKAEAKGF